MEELIDNERDGEERSRGNLAFIYSRKFQLAAPSISLTRISYAMRRLMLRGGGFNSADTEDAGEYEKRLKRGCGDTMVGSLEILR